MRRGVSRTLHATLRGTKLNPSPDPSNIVRNPFNTVTLQAIVPQVQAGIAQVITTSSLRELLNSQLSLNTDYEVRVKSIRLWNLSGTAIAARIYDLQRSPSSTNQDIITTLVDYAGRNQWATIGYVFPASITNNVLHCTDTPTEVVALIEAPNVDDNILMHIEVLWKARTGILPTSLSSTLHGPPEGEVTSIFRPTYTPPALISNEV